MAFKTLFWLSSLFFTRQKGNLLHNFINDMSVIGSVFSYQCWKCLIQFLGNLRWLAVEMAALQSSRPVSSYELEQELLSFISPSCHRNGAVDGTTHNGLHLHSSIKPADVEDKFQTTSVRMLKPLNCLHAYTWSDWFEKQSNQASFHNWMFGLSFT